MNTRSTCFLSSKSCVHGGLIVSVGFGSQDGWTFPSEQAASDFMRAHFPDFSITMQVRTRRSTGCCALMDYACCMEVFVGSRVVVRVVCRHRARNRRRHPPATPWTSSISCTCTSPTASTTTPRLGSRTTARLATQNRRSAWRSGLVATLRGHGRMACNRRAPTSCKL